MIRLRKTDGTYVELRDEFKFVEICDKEGRVAELTVEHGDGSIRQIHAGEDEAVRYSELFGAEFCPIKILP